MTPSAFKLPRLLIATSNLQLKQRIASLLNCQNYSMEYAADSNAAARILLDDNPPAIALLDTALPGQSSVELAAEIKRRNLDKHVWIIQLITDQVDPSAIDLAADAGVDDLLLCPDGEGPSRSDLLMRLGVAARVLDHIQRLQTRVHAISLHSLRDSLTGLWNRESTLSQLFTETDRVQRMNTPLCLLLLDIDNFSQINRERGHEVGDQILQEMATRLRRYMRSYDVLGRVGNDEFLIVLPGCPFQQASHLADRIRTVMLHTPFAADDRKMRITATIGIAQSRGRTPLVVLREAEQSLEAARHESRAAAHPPLESSRDLALQENHTA